MSTIISQTHPLDLVGATERLKQDVSEWLASPARQTPGLTRFTIPVDAGDPISWLHAQPANFKFFWSERETEEEVAAAGTADQVMVRPGETARDLLPMIHRRLNTFSGEDARYYGGMAFDSERISAGWESLQTGSFVLPRFEFRRPVSGAGQLICHILLPQQNTDGALKAVAADLERLTAMAHPIPALKDRPVRRRDYPGSDAWTATVADLLNILRGEPSFKKIVLARQTELSFLTPPDGMALLARLRNITRNCYLFYVQTTPGTAFLGASPERLYRREGNRVVSEALAGTRRQGRSPEEDAGLRRDLQTSDKELLEHQYVAEMVRGALASVCETIHGSPDPVLVSVNEAHHLMTRFEGVLQNGRGDADLLPALHPTPAVAGTPRDAAMARIRTAEPFGRGWYAGPIGYLGRETSELAVGIRSGLLSATTLKLYSGAGIVTGSEPENEWKETEYKIGNFLKLFGPSDETSGKP